MIDPHYAYIAVLQLIDASMHCVTWKQSAVTTTNVILLLVSSLTGHPHDSVARSRRLVRQVISRRYTKFVQTPSDNDQVGL